MDNKKDNIECLKVVCISDTHTNQKKIIIPENTDILIHSGDFTSSGTEKEIKKFCSWLDKQNVKHKIVIAGNHDIVLDKASYEDHLRQKFHGYYKVKQDPDALKTRLKQSCHYLEHESVTVEGYNIFGSPYTLEFYDWAFMYKKYEAFQKWAAIPDNTDIVITHGPPFGILDLSDWGKVHVGCEELLIAITQRVKPLYHIFGHIHEQYGQVEQDGIKFINASSCTQSYKLENSPIVFNLPKKPSK